MLVLKRLYDTLGAQLIESKCDRGTDETIKFELKSKSKISIHLKTILNALVFCSQ